MPSPSVATGSAASRRWCRRFSGPHLALRIDVFTRVRAGGLQASFAQYQPSTCGPDTPSRKYCQPPDRWSVSRAAIAQAVSVRAMDHRVPSRTVASTGPTRPAACERRDPTPHGLPCPPSSAGDEFRMVRGCANTPAVVELHPCATTPSGAMLKTLVGALFYSTGVTAGSDDPALHVVLRLPVRWGHVKQVFHTLRTPHCRVRGYLTGESCAAGEYIDLTHRRNGTGDRVDRRVLNPATHC